MQLNQKGLIMSYLLLIIDIMRINQKRSVHSAFLE
jgi:hypothetical protein